MARYLSAVEKERIVAQWWTDQKVTPPPGVDGADRGYPDPEVILWCEKLNGLPGICTVQSCSGHKLGDSHLQSGHFWIRLDEKMSAAFDEAAFELAAQEGIERVGKFYSEWGEEITDLTFAGLERDSLPQSMQTIFEFFSKLADGRME